MPEADDLLPFFQPGQDLICHLLSMGILQVTQIMSGLLPAIAHVGQQGTETGITQTNTRFVKQIETQAINCPDIKVQPDRAWSDLQQFLNALLVGRIRFFWLPATLAMT